MRRTTIKLAAGLAVLATAGGGAVQLAGGSGADRPSQPDKAPASRALTPHHEKRLLHNDYRKKDAVRAKRALASAASFDPIVEDALEDTAGIAGLVDDVLLDLPEQPVPSAGGITPGDISGGSGTNDILGFINEGGSDIAGMTDRVLAGKDLTPEQKEICEFLIRKGPSIEAWGDIMAVNDQIDIDLANAHLRELYPLGFHDSYGNFWMPDHETGRWTRVTEDARGGSRRFNPGPLAPPPSFPNDPPSSPGDNSGSIDNDEPKPSLVDDPPLSFFD